jgi:hypothetical protein
MLTTECTLIEEAPQSTAEAWFLPFH